VDFRKQQTKSDDYRPKPNMCNYCGEKPRKKKYRINMMNAEGAKMFCSQKCKDAYLSKYKQ
jgi:hypothetical protein